MSHIRSSYTDACSFYGRHTPRELAETYGTPLYVYNENILRQRCRELKGLSAHPGFGVNYSVKANANPVLLKVARQEGLVVDAMSPGELHMDELAGFTPKEILYISNNNSAAELQNALVKGLLVSVDSLSQLDLLGSLNPGGKVMVRFNPGIGAGHHAKVITAGKATKFGVTPDKLDDVLALLKRHNLTLAGINQHIGSLFMEPDGYLNAATVLLHLAERLPAATLATLEVIDFGGGFGIPYHKYDNETRLDMADLGARLHALISDWAAQTGYQGRFLVEPGRYVAAECGVLLGRVHAVKNNGDRRYVGTDLGFNVLVRPAMYDSFHDFEIYEAPGACARDALPQTIVGNICESGDILAKDRTLPALHEGDVLGVLDAGAYGFTMGSNYNMRRRPAEVLIQSDGTARLIRRRENLEDLARCLLD
ncbi:diaminopimelate decarboxylase [uncultured Desulfovibrio sp.]|uniref:diaminopimelate decarboxylase n=1 Tax=uncultured Desulfovibrio sp. TaxID=167968 RepID=UPI001AAB32AF|nr:diaminopimelate decarboxylase [uncultured Desulfovibrio sp.]CAI3227813.1 Diaminopimelate decarboxylase (EC [Desulfovibrio diazotrophicus]VVU43135.1 Diaminopimelate decarboxylase (EC [Desulfovibrio diazotrophicus]